MDTGAIDSLAEEATAATLPVAAVLEGLEDYLSLKDLRTDSQAELQALLSEYQRRRGILADLSTALTATRAARSPARPRAPGAADPRGGQ